MKIYIKPKFVYELELVFESITQFQNLKLEYYKEMIFKEAVIISVFTYIIIVKLLN